MRAMGTVKEDDHFGEWQQVQVDSEGRVILSPKSIKATAEELLKLLKEKK